MSTHCHACGAVHEEDDTRPCAACRRVERAARAVFSLLHDERVVVEIVPGFTAWDNLPAAPREALRAVARAALAAAEETP